MKKYIGLLLFLSFFVFGDEEVTEIFETYKDSIVYVQQTLYFESSSVKYPENFKRLENHYDMKILDAYFTIASGSGFFISNEGHIMTNHHVIDISDLEEEREDILWGWLDAITRDLPDSMFSGKEFGQIIDDFETLFKKSKFHFRLTIKNEVQHEFEIVKSDKTLDIAILKIPDDEEFTALPLGDSDSLKVGKSVIALGYPLQSVFDLFLKFKELKSTLTTGNIAALRNENWGIQHTATINFGNSGGPLITLDGEVVGVNVAKVGSTIFFAIPANKIYTWLNNTGQDDLVTLNEETATRYSGGSVAVTSTKDNILKTGKSLFIKLEKPYKIFIDDELKGTTPLLIKDLTPGDAFLRIESENEYHGIQLQVMAERTDIVTYTPVMGKYLGNLFVESTPPGAKILIDGRALGETPAALSDITAEKHTLTLSMKEYRDYEEEVVIKKKDTLSVSVELVKTYEITFQDPLPEETKVKVSHGDEESLFSGDEEIRVPAGNWTVEITNRYFKKASFTCDITGDKEINFTPEYYRSQIFFNNLMPESRVLLNKSDITAQVKDGSYETRVGYYELRIKTKDYKDYCKKMELEKDKEVSVQVIYEVSHALKGRKNAWIGYPLLGTGVLMGVTGFILNNDKIALDISDSYNDYATLKWTGFTFICTGVVSTVVGTVFVFISLQQEKKAQVDTEIWDIVRFSIDIQDNAPMFLVHIPLKD